MKIAVFFAIWNKDYVNYIYRGLKQYAMSHPVQLDVYLCFGKQGYEKVNDEAEYAFFRMPKLSDYDGIIEFGITMMYKKERRQFLDKLRATGKPLISVESQKPGCSWVGIDQYQAMKDIMQHMRQVHDAHLWGYAGGIKGTYEADIREKAFLDMVKEEGLLTSQEWLFHMEYLYEDGIAIGKKILDANQEGRQIPDTIICANDEMAEGICDTLYDTGLWNKVHITGFDGYLNAERFSPALTTIQRPREQVAVECCQLMEKMLREGITEPVHKALGYQLVLGSSCGCKKHHNIRERDRCHRYSFHREQHKFQMEKRLEKMEEHTTSEITKEEILEEIHTVFEEFGLKHCKFYMRENLLSEKPATYRSCTHVTADWYFGEKNEAAERLVLYVPVHFQRRVMGYCTLVNADAMLEYHVLETMIRKISFSLENYIQKQQYHEINKKYQLLYMTDQLTGLYNRFGLNDLGLKLYERNCSEKRDTLIVFCDINRLKYINDTFGHKAGDWAIQLVGDILEEQKTDSCLPFRYGGDEFILIADACTGKDLITRIQQLLSEKQDLQPQDFHLDISIGSIVAPWKESKELETYFIQADEMMYQAKMKYYKEHSDIEDKK